jgi:hypothetical protein
MSSPQTSDEFSIKRPGAEPVDAKLDITTLTGFLREAEQRHGDYSPTAPKHHWSDWYAAYVVARERGRTPQEAAGDGALYIESISR